MASAVYNNISFYLSGVKILNFFQVLSFCLRSPKKTVLHICMLLLIKDYGCCFILWIKFSISKLLFSFKCRIEMVFRNPSGCRRDSFQLSCLLKRILVLLELSFHLVEGNSSTLRLYLHLLQHHVFLIFLYPIMGVVIIYLSHQWTYQLVFL